MSSFSRISRPFLRSATLPRTRRAAFHASRRLGVVKSFNLSDPGEGVQVCQIIQWYVQPGARVAQFDPICEIQSDKAATEITARYDGVIKKLHHAANDEAYVGQPLYDIDVDPEVAAEDEDLKPVGEVPHAEEAKPEVISEGIKEKKVEDTAAEVPWQPISSRKDTEKCSAQNNSVTKNDNRSLATPAVRRLSKELGVEITSVNGSGKDGRVLKEDIRNHADNQTATQSSDNKTVTTSNTSTHITGEDQEIPIAGIKAQMFKTMTKSLSIPHFLYADTVDFSSLNRIRSRLLQSSSKDTTPIKLSPLPFIVKAVSNAFLSYPGINAHLNTLDANKPRLTHKAAHHIGIAIDTEHGLVVPVLKNVQSLSISQIAAEIRRLSQVARANKLTRDDLVGATFTVSNVGSIGGTTTMPVIVAPAVAIVAIGRAKAVPAFADDGSIVRREEVVFSWTADHRVVDGAYLARCAEEVRRSLEDVERMVISMR